MQVDGSPSWTISTDRWSQRLDVALWFRDVERMDVPRSGPVPGPIDLDPLPDPSTRPGDAIELAAGWSAWWDALVQAPSPSVRMAPLQPPEPGPFDPPALRGLGGWPVLQQVVKDRWEEASRWNADRLRTGLLPLAHGDGQTSRVMAEIETELGRKARPFMLELVILPVRDDDLRAVNQARYLVPEAVYDGERWPRILRQLVEPLA